MAAITLNIPDAQIARVITAVCASKVTPEPVAPTGAIAKAIEASWVRECVLAYEVAQVPPPDVTGLVS